MAKKDIPLFPAKKDISMILYVVSKKHSMNRSNQAMQRRIKKPLPLSREAVFCDLLL
jgi:mevalonate pyrophosphate decarboxylase